jgi:hypothetical protein
MLAGRCLCERVRYQIQGALGPIYHCHCSKCRRWHGAAFRTRASIRRQQFSWLTGEDCLSRYASSDNVTKYFCRVCGSPLISEYKDRPDVLGVPLGGLEGELAVGAQAHIFVDHKASWFAIADDFPQFGAWPESEAAVRTTAPVTGVGQSDAGDVSAV